MNTNIKTSNTLASQPDESLQKYVELFRHYKYWILAALVVGLSLSILYSKYLPDIYRSQTLILVESQKIPPAYVTPTTTDSIEERLNTLSQQIMSRTNLEKIIKKLKLYEEFFDTDRKNLNNVLKMKINDLLTKFGYQDLQSDTVSEFSLDNLPSRYIDRMRGHIEVQVVGRGNDAFQVAYSGRDPETVRKVTDTLASLFIEGNLKAREHQVITTGEFLDDQLEKAGRELSQQESRLKKFKESNMGTLPEQIDGNLNKLNRLQSEMQTLDESLWKLKEKKMVFENRIHGADDESLNVRNIFLSGNTNTDDSILKELKEKLAVLRSKFKETYPDIVAIKRQIQEIDSQRVNTVSNSQEAPGNQEEQENQDREIKEDDSYFREQLELANAEIAILEIKKADLRRSMQVYEEKVEKTYENEQRLYDLTRDYQTSMGNYQSLLQKRLNSKLSEELEKRQKGERFRIIDPAHLPDQPYKPNRLRIVLIGSMLSVGLAMGLVMLREHARSGSFKKVKDLDGLFDLPALAEVPWNRISYKNRYLISAEETDSIITEQYRILYTNLIKSTTHSKHQIFAVTSAIPNEGKTMTTLNLGVIIARDFGRKVLLLEGDLKKPALSLYLTNTPSHYRIDDAQDTLPNLPARMTGHGEQSSDVPFALRPSSFIHNNLTILPVDQALWNSSGILSSKWMTELLDDFRTLYDFVLIDAPPILPLSDMNIFRELIDGVILVVKADSTKKTDIERSIQAFGRDKLVGFVLNGVQQQLPNYYREYKAISYIRA